MIKSEDTYLSIVLPVFNEEATLPLLMKELYSVCNSLGRDYEIIFVNDASWDDTPDILERLADKDPRIKVLHFSRNFGHQAALSAGIDVAKGELVVTMDSDLQHPPSIILEFIKHAEDGSDIVIGERALNQQNSFIRESLGKLFYKFLSFVTNLEFRNVSDFALYKKPVIKVLKSLPEGERFLRGMVQWIGFKKKYTPYTVEARKYGQPKYSTKRLIGFITNGVTSFSAFPLRLAFWLGLIIFIFGIGFSAYVMVDHYTNPNPLNAGSATIVILILALGSIQMILLGVTGEYLYKMFNEIKGRPMYIVAKTNNLETNELEKTSYGVYAK
jgi:dolichol-phosphate mannosyltransferase